MRRHSALFFCIALLLLTVGCATGPKHQALKHANLPDTLRIKSIFFDIHRKTDYKVSPDGKKIAWLANKEGKRTIFYRHLNSDKTRTVTHWLFKTIYHIGNFYWAADSRHILYHCTNENAERTHIFSSNIEKYGHYSEDLTPFKHHHARIHRILKNDPEHIIIQKYQAAGTIKRISTMDLIKLNIYTGEQELIIRNPGNVSRWITDQAGEVRARICNASLEARTLEAKRPADGKWEPVLSWTIDDRVQPIQLTPANDGIFLLSNIGRDRLSLRQLTFEDGKEVIVHEDPEVDLSDVVFGKRSQLPALTVSHPDYPKIHILDPSFSDVLTQFNGKEKFGISAYSSDNDEQLLTLMRYTEKNQTWYLLNRNTKELKKLSERFPKKTEACMSPMTPISFASHDGRKIHGYITLPRGTKGHQLPMVLYVHGGPWSRDRWGYRRTVQFLANRGYAVLQVNYRGSSGYGRDHLTAAKGEFAGKMHSDLIDAVHWAIAEGFADPKHIAIYGHSYGGYAALVGATFTPDVFACSISVNGISNLASMISSKDIKDNDFMAWYSWHKYVGDPQDPMQKADLEARSPLFKVDRIQRPLLIVQGAKDKRTPMHESEAMVKALRSEDKQVDYILFREENHHIRWWKNTFRLYYEIEAFLARHIGGRRVIDGD